MQLAQMPGLDGKARQSADRETGTPTATDRVIRYRRRRLASAQLATGAEHGLVIGFGTTPTLEGNTV
jgi:hypothetical protein